MSKELIMELAKEIQDASISYGGWSVFDLSTVETENVSLFVLALERAIEYADQNNMIIFENTSGVIKSNAQLHKENAEFDYEYEELLNEFKDAIYSEVCAALIELGGECIESTPEVNAFRKTCLEKGISEEDIESFGTMERFYLVCKIGESKERTEFKYRMLFRLKSDCEYYLGFGNRSKNRLYYKDEQEHIDEMKKLYNSFPKDQQPVWLTYEKILSYEKAMLNN